MSCLLILRLFQKIRMLRKVEMAFGVLSVVRYIFPQVLQTYFKSVKLFCSLFFFSSLVSGCIYSSKSVYLDP